MCQSAKRIERRINLKYFSILAFLIISCDNTTEPEAELEIREVKYLLTNYCDGYEQTEPIEDDYTGPDATLVYFDPMFENYCYAYETPYFANNYISSHNFDESEFSESIYSQNDDDGCLYEIDQFKFEAYRDDGTQMFVGCDFSPFPNTSRILHYTYLGYFEIMGNPNATFFEPEADENYAFGYY